jgi:hypothetical protein
MNSNATTSQNAARPDLAERAVEHGLDHQTADVVGGLGLELGKPVAQARARGHLAQKTPEWCSSSRSVA